VTVSKSPEGLNGHFGTADGPCMNFTQLWLPPPGKVLFFLDTCYAGAFTQGIRSGDTQPDIDRLVNELADAETGAVVFASSTGRQVSIEDKRWNNGAFTKALPGGARRQGRPQPGARGPGERAGQLPGQPGQGADWGKAVAGHGRGECPGRCCKWASAAD
jgi:hypothetical protein